MFTRFCTIYAPTIAKTMCDAARTTTTGSSPENWKPIVVPIAVKIADMGEMNIAIKIGTWAVRVAVNAGGRITRKKPNAVGMIIPNAISNAVITRFFVLSDFFIM